MVIVGGALTATAVTAGVWYYFTPKYFRVGYQPIQPVAFSHATHNGQLGIDCRYCHSAVEKSWFSNIPSSSTCMNCHNQVLKDDPRLALVRESAASGKPIYREAFNGALTPGRQYSTANIASRWQGRLGLRINF